MKEHRVSDGKTGHYTIFQSENVEYIDPTNFFADAYIKPKASIYKSILLSKKAPVPLDTINAFVTKLAKMEWEKKYDEFIKTEVPVNFISLLESKSKKEQIGLLKGQSITPEQLTALILKAYKDFGFTFSHYFAEHHHNGVNISDLPRIIEIRNGNVSKVGNTSLSEGQLKQLVQHRKVVVSKFLDREDSWHCLFLTFKSLRGEESWKNGQPHLHYISDKFGIKRDKVVSDLQSKYYSLGTLPHIDLLGYRDKE